MMFTCVAQQEWLKEVAQGYLSDEQDRKLLAELAVGHNKDSCYNSCGYQVQTPSMDW